MAVFRQQVEAIDHIVVQENLADLPDHALVHHSRADAEAIPQFQRAFRKADRTGAVADPVCVIQQHHGMATLSQIDRQSQANGACSDHHHRMARGIGGASVLIGMAAIAELNDPGFRHVSPPCSIDGLLK